MLDIIETKENGVLNYALKGRLDTKTAPDFEGKLRESLNGIECLTINMAELEYISSAGLRVLLFAKKQMKKNDMYLENVNESVMEVLDMTGFADILDIR